MYPGYLGVRPQAVKGEGRICASHLRTASGREYSQQVTNHKYDVKTYFARCKHVASGNQK